MLRTLGHAAVAAPWAAQLARADDSTGAIAKSPIKIGQIGIGHAHATKLAVYRQSPDYDVVGIVEPDIELRQKLSSHPAYRDLPILSQEELLNRKDVQACPDRDAGARFAGRRSSLCGCWQTHPFG